MTRIIVVCLFAVSLSAQTFYVDTMGSDTTGIGSQGNPWATIQFALDQVPDEALVLVGPGEYFGRTRLRGIFPVGVTVRSEVRYQAQLRHTSTVVTCFYGVGITLEGFDIAHTGPGAGALVIQVQNLNVSPDPDVSRIVFRDNVIHDSFNNDLLKINNGALDILVEGNIFYNQAGSDEHIDINGVVNIEVRDNIFFNDFEGSGRPNNNDTSSFIVIKNSGAHPLNEQFHIHRNVFLNWQGSSGSNFLLFGEDGQAIYEAEDAWVENNLFIGNSPNNMRAAWGVKGCRLIRFRNNTVVGDLPALAFAMRINQEGANLVNDEISFYNNVWCDPTATMGAEFGQSNNDFSDTPPTATDQFVIEQNLYWNGGAPVPDDPNELINMSDDALAVVGDPQLPAQAAIVLPRWDAGSMTFVSGNSTIREEFLRLVNGYGKPGLGSPVTDMANPLMAPLYDILGEIRGPNPDLGAFELDACSLPSDLDGDFDVDADDLAILVSLWRTDFPFDLNQDGEINVLDMIILIDSYGSCL